jgi:hypothetical protein
MIGCQVASECLARDEGMLFGQLAAGEVVWDRRRRRPSMVMMELAVGLHEMVSGKVLMDTALLCARARFGEVFACFAYIYLFALALRPGQCDRQRQCVDQTNTSASG